MSKRFYKKGDLWCYRMMYKRHLLRRKNFATKGDAEKHLREALAKIDAEDRGEFVGKPTTVQDALNLYKRQLEVRARDKGKQYEHNINSSCRVLQEFTDRFGVNRLCREVTSTDLREFYQILSLRGLSKNSAGTLIQRLQGMFKCARESRQDLATWLPPKLAVKRPVEYERRVVEPWEYEALLQVLENPPLAASHREDRRILWRDAADAVRLLRNTGGRLNEVLRLQVGQCNFARKTIRLYASKTETERDVPMTESVFELLKRRICFKDQVLVFPRAATVTFDNAIARAVRKAAKKAGLKYGQAEGFTLHSFRHTFITDLMQRTNNDAGTVMKLSGHKSLASFSNYLHTSDLAKHRAIAAMEDIDQHETPKVIKRKFKTA